MLPEHACLFGSGLSILKLMVLCVLKSICKVIHDYHDIDIHSLSETYTMSCEYTVSSQVIIGTSIAAVCVVFTLLVSLATIGVFKFHRKVREVHMNARHITTDNSDNQG